MTKAILAASFDPMTKGHLWLIKAATDVFPELVVAVADNPNKKYTFTKQERVHLVAETLATEIKTINKLFVSEINNQYLVEYAKETNANYIVRGIRTESDFEYEREMMHLNNIIEPSIQTMFFIPPKNVSGISSSVVKSLIGPVGWEKIVKDLVPQNVFHSLLSKFSQSK